MSAARPRTLLFSLPIGIENPAARNERGSSLQDADGFNLPDHVIDVPVYLDPQLETHGMNEYMYDGRVIVLREWNLAVLVHEIAHIALDVVAASRLVTDMADQFNHALINPVELAFAPLIHRLAAEDRRRRPQAVVDPPPAPHQPRA